MRMRVFLDANILFSAAGTESKTANTLAKLIKNGHEAVTNSYAWDEAADNLTKKRPHTLGTLEKLRGLVKIIDDTKPYLTFDCEEKDRQILAGAIGTGCSHLWTGDKKHFGMFYGRRIHGVLVVPSVPLE